MTMTTKEQIKHDAAVALWLKDNKVKVGKPQKAPKIIIGQKYTVYNLGRKTVTLNQGGV